MRSLYTYIIQESFIDNVFSKFKKTSDIMQRINKAEVSIDSLAKSTIGTYKSVNKDGIKAWIGDITYLISNDDKCKQQWERGVFKALSQMNDKTKKEIILDLYNNEGKGFKDIYNLILMLSDKMKSLYKWKTVDQTIYKNNNEESSDTINYDLFIDTLQIIAVEIKNKK